MIASILMLALSLPSCHHDRFDPDAFVFAFVP